MVGREFSVGRGGSRPVASPPRGRGAPPGKGRVVGSRAGSPGACGENRSAAAGAPAQAVGWRQLFDLCSLLALGAPRERTPPAPYATTGGTVQVCRYSMTSTASIFRVKCH